jgi:leucyl-tRNA synthetase
MRDTLAYESWPTYKPEFIAKESVTIGVMIGGKHRGNIEISLKATKEEVLELARSQDFVKRNLEGKNVKQEIYVPGKILNLVLG